MTSEVISMITTVAGWVGGSGIVIWVLNRYAPSKQDAAELRKTSAEGRKAKAEADQLGLEIHVQMKTLMDEETKRHAHLFYKREMEYREELDRCMDKLNEARKNIEIYVIKLKEAYDRINSMMDEKESSRKSNS